MERALDVVRQKAAGTGLPMECLQQDLIAPLQGELQASSGSGCTASGACHCCRRLGARYCMLLALGCGGRRAAACHAAQSQVEQLDFWDSLGSEHIVDTAARLGPAPNTRNIRLPLTHAQYAAHPFAGPAV